jgi:hypothetical protein
MEEWARTAGRVELFIIIVKEKYYFHVGKVNYVQCL